MLKLAPEMMADLPIFTQEEQQKIDKWYRYYRAKYDKAFDEHIKKGRWAYPVRMDSAYNRQLDDIRLKENAALQAAGERYRCL